MKPSSNPNLIGNCMEGFVYLDMMKDCTENLRVPSNSYMLKIYMEAFRTNETFLNLIRLVCRMRNHVEAFRTTAETFPLASNPNNEQLSVCQKPSSNSQWQWSTQPCWNVLCSWFTTKYKYRRVCLLWRIWPLISKQGDNLSGRREIIIMTKRMNGIYKRCCPLLANNSTTSDEPGHLYSTNSINSIDIFL